MKRNKLIIYITCIVIIFAVTSGFFVINNFKNKEIPISTYKENNDDKEKDNIPINDETNENSNKEEIIEVNKENKTNSNKNNNKTEINKTDSKQDKPKEESKEDNKKNESEVDSTKDNDISTNTDKEPEEEIEEEKFYTSWGELVKKPKYNNKEECTTAGEQLRLSIKNDAGWYPISGFVCDPIYDSKKSDRKIVGYDILDLICLEYIYDESGNRTEHKYSCNEYLK